LAQVQKGDREVLDSLMKRDVLPLSSVDHLKVIEMGALDEEAALRKLERLALNPWYYTEFKQLLEDSKSPSFRRARSRFLFGTPDFEQMNPEVLLKLIEDGPHPKLHSVLALRQEAASRALSLIRRGSVLETEKERLILASVRVAGVTPSTVLSVPEFLETKLASAQGIEELRSLFNGNQDDAIREAILQLKVVSDDAIRFLATGRRPEFVRHLAENRIYAPEISSIVLGKLAEPIARGNQKSFKEILDYVAAMPTNRVTPELQDRIADRVQELTSMAVNEDSHAALTSAIRTLKNAALLSPKARHALDAAVRMRAKAGLEGMVRGCLSRALKTIF
jgi:hypothetical protein